MTRQIYQLKITLSDVSPAVWRRVQLPGAYTLDRVHRVIQLAMGWHNAHLHSFEIRGVQYGEPDPDGELALLDELDTRLDAVAEAGARFTYTYDFGDWWEHQIEVEEVFPADPDEHYPRCLDGARACPPEDVGGAYGYSTFLAAFADPYHAQHEESLEWAGKGFDPAAFNAALATTLLRRMV
jgi:pRiA4b ORF-3-like protein